jgi:hypothetical protein
MGWTESPGYFCAATETGRNIMQALIDGGTEVPPHIFELYMSPEAVVLEPLVPSMHHKLMQIHSNNTPSVAWLTKMATKTANSDAAHHLVRELTLCQQMLHSAPVSITHEAGLDNNLADIA